MLPNRECEGNLAVIVAEREPPAVDILVWATVELFKDFPIPNWMAIRCLDAVDRFDTFKRDININIQLNLP